MLPPYRLPRVRLLALLIVVICALTPAAYAETSTPDPIGQDPFVAGHRYAGDFPDPAALHAGTSYFAYATTTANLNLPVVTSKDLTTWYATGPRHRTSLDALPSVPTWAWQQPGHPGKGTVWAPSVSYWGGRFLVAYTVRKKGKAAQMCISTATSSSPRGPFTDHTKVPLECPPDRGAIDPMLYHEGGNLYLLYKTEDIAKGSPTRLWIRKLSATGRGFAEKGAHLLLTADQDWEGRVVEAPAMVRFHGTRYLFFSANGWGNPNYSTGYAVCTTLIGPCTLPASPDPTDPTAPWVTSPLLTSTGTIVGPGGANPIIDTTGQLRLVFHAWTAGATSYPTSTKCRSTAAGCGQRRMHEATLAQNTDGTLAVTSLN